jgi:uncharacterized BrkB/YihY/UPF0761 family membrane protein
LVAGARDRTVGGNLLACAIAYRLFLWMLPASLVLVAGLGFLGAAEAEAPSDVASDVGLSAYVASSVADAAEEAEEGRWALLAVGLVALAISSAGGAKTVRAVHAMAWQVPLEKPRSPVVAALGFTGFVLAAIAASLVGNWARDNSPGLGLSVRLGTVIVFAALWWVASAYLPRAPGVPWTRLLPGALLMGAGAQVLHLVTVLYLAGKLESASELYGGLGASAAVLLWLYLVGRLLVGSAVLNATLEERRRAGSGPSPAAI